MSSKVKQANFRLPLEYMALIDEFAQREEITKAAVITRALDCMRASYEAGHGGMPVTAADSSEAEKELADLKEKLTSVEARAAITAHELENAKERAAAAEARANSAIAARDAAEAEARKASAEAAAAPVSSFSDDEVIRLKTQVASQEATIEEKTKALAAKDVALEEKTKALAAKDVALEEKTKALAAKDVEVATKDADIAAKTSIIAERDARIETLTQQYNEVNAKAQAVAQVAPAMSAFAIEGGTDSSCDAIGAMSVLTMLGGVMGAFQQQVDDARKLGEEEGRRAAREEFKDVVSKARNDGYRDAMTYLDDRVSTAREAGAKEERARIANMGFFERRRYLKVHLS